MLTKKWLAQLPIGGIQQVIPVHGGDINQAYRVRTTQQDYFLKVQPQ